MKVTYCLRAMLCLCLMAIACLSYGQTPAKKTITGRITDSETKKAVEGAVVTRANTNQKTITDEDGNFSLNAQPKDTLIISSVGYQVMKIEVNAGGARIIAELMPEAGALQEVTVNTGYQRLPKERATGSFDVVGNQLFNRRVSTNVLDRIENLTPGVLFDRNAGAPDALLIRGRSTIYANAAPLIVVDNFPYDGDINNINPNDVESITILKDAAAASIWGARAGNGVIVITTKRGKTAKPAVELNTSVTLVQKPDLYNVNTISSSDYIELEKWLFAQGFYANDELFNQYSFGHPPFTPVVSLLIASRDSLITAGEANTLIEGYRGQDARQDIGKYLYRTAVNQQHSLNVSGNTGNLNYYMSAGWDKNLQSLSGSEYDRISLRSGNTFTVSPKLQLSLAISYAQSRSSSGNNQGYGLNNGGGKGLYPYARLVNNDGSPAILVKDNNLSFTDTAGNGYLADWTYNPINDIAAEKHLSTNKDYLVTAGISYTILNGLSAEARYQYETLTASNTDEYTAQSYFTRSMSNQYAQVDYTDGAVYLPIPKGGILDYRTGNTVSQQGRAQLAYHYRFRTQHELAAVAGWEIKDFATLDNTGRYYGYRPELSTVYPMADYITEFVPFDNPYVSYKVPNPAAISRKSDRFLSYYFNGSYTFANRYVFSASTRHDAANLFGVAANERGTPLWSAGAAWIADKETFYHWDWLPSLKLRATYGYSGNIARNATSYTTAIYAPPYSTNAEAAVIQSPPNSRLQWERVRMMNLGIDFGTKNRVVSGSIEYYRKRATDLLGQAPLDPTLGTDLSYSGSSSYYYGNVAGMKGSGWDVQLSSRNITRRFTWTTDAQFSYAATHITDYQLPVSTGSSYLTSNFINPVIGKPVYGMYSFRWGGLDPVTGAAQGLVNGKPSEDYSSIYSSTLLDSLVYSGPAQPRYFGAVRNTFGWKGISLSFNISYQMGYFFRKKSIFYSDLYSTWTGSGDYSKRWQQPGDEAHTNVPARIYPADATADAFYAYSSVLVLPGDHVRLEDVTVSYDMDKAQVRRLPFAHLRVYVYAGNLGVLWVKNKEGIDPYYNNVPAAGKSLALGVTISF